MTWRTRMTGGRKEEEARLPRPSDRRRDSCPSSGRVVLEVCVVCRSGSKKWSGWIGNPLSCVTALPSFRERRQRPRRKRSAVRRTDKEGIGLYLMYWIGWHGRIMPRARVVVTPQTRPEGGRPPEVPDNEGKGIHKIFRTSITPGDAVCPTAR